MEKFSSEEREHIARRLVTLVDGIPELGGAIRAAGFAAWKPIEAFDLSFCTAEEVRLRQQILLEESREILGSTTWILFRTEDGQGETAYASPLLNSMRMKRDEELGLPPGSKKPRELFNYSYLFFGPRRRKDFALAPYNDGMAKLKIAWADAYRVMDEEGSARFPEIADTKWEGMGFPFGVDRKLVAQYLAPVGFDVPAKLRTSAYIVARTSVDLYWLLFCVDTRHPMQLRFLLIKPYEDKEMLYKFREQIQLPLNDVFLNPIGGSVPYSHPRTPRQLVMSMTYYALVLGWLVPRIRTVLTT
jgi:hypothetical protein